jgi:hypothetical protein
VDTSLHVQIAGQNTSKELTMENSQRFLKVLAFLARLTGMPNV